MNFRNPSLRLLGIALLVLGTARSAVAGPVEITDAQYEGRDQFRIVTAGATWFYDKAGGGFSRLLDTDGHDWISFHDTHLAKAPAGAAGGFRGIPNLVFGKQNPDAGAGHPGFDRCESVVSGPDTIRSTSRSGKWAWSWRFAAGFAELTIERADAEQPWWFLYEGTPGGRFAPRQQYWGTDLGGPNREVPSHSAKNDNRGRWRWIYFGDEAVDRVLFVADREGDAIDDQFSYMGSSAAGIDAPDGMVVFGFGRLRSKPLMTGAGRHFLVGFLEQPVKDRDSHERVKQRIGDLLQP